MEPSHIYVESTTDLFPTDADRLGPYVFERDQVYTRLQLGSDRVLMNHGTITSKTVKAIPIISLSKYNIIRKLVLTPTLLEPVPYMALTYLLDSKINARIIFLVVLLEVFRACKATNTNINQVRAVNLITAVFPIAWPWVDEMTVVFCIAEGQLICYRNFAVVGGSHVSVETKVQCSVSCWLVSFAVCWFGLVWFVWGTYLLAWFLIGPPSQFMANCTRMAKSTIASMF